MKTFKNYKIYILGLLLATFNLGCNHFEDMNENPLASTDMDPNLMLSTVQMDLSGERFETWRNQFIYGADWMHLWTGEWATVEFGGKGRKNEQYMSALWSSQYPREVRNIVNMVNRTADDPETVNINAVSRIMKVLIFSRLTDLYGDIPYFDAGAASFNDQLTPVFDRQEDIYNDFFSELDLAASALDPSADVVSNDFYFEGNIERWRRFANSLRLRLAMRLIKVDPSKAQSEAEAAIASGVMQSNSDMAIMYFRDAPFGDGGEGGNGVSYTFLSSGTSMSEYRIGRSLAARLDSTMDPRLRLLAGSYLDDEDRTDVTDQVLAIVGNYTDLSVPHAHFRWEVAPGATDVDVNGESIEVSGDLQLMQPNKVLSRFDAPYIVMSYAEVALWMAEAAQRGWSASGTAIDHYNTALAAGIQQYAIYGLPEVGSTDIEDYITANPLVAGSELEQINTQLWINFALNPQQAYANWRRSGFPNIAFSDRWDGVNESNNQVPRRMQYPASELQLNRENATEALQRLGLSNGEDDWTTRVWWDAL